MSLETCTNCGHVSAHTGGGIGVCASVGCGCDSLLPVPVPSPGLRVEAVAFEEMAVEVSSAPVHDAFCPAWGGGVEKCCCDLIAAVRADEQEKADRRRVARRRVPLWAEED